MNLKGQGATEYLVLLGVVLVIALVAIALLGFFPGLAGSTKETQARTYWNQAAPFTIKEYRYSGTSLNLTMENMGSDKLTVTGVTVNGTAGTLVSTSFNGGQTQLLNITGSIPSCTAGSQFEYDLNITYNSKYQNGFTQVGAKPIVGTCN